MVGTPEKRDANGDIDSDAMLAVAKSTSGNIVIPESFDGYTVVEIGREAFRNVEIIGVTIPTGVTKIGNKAFYRSGIINAEILGNVTWIDEEAFSRTKITSIPLPESLVRIGEQAFEQTLLTSITIPASVTNLGDMALGNSLKEVKYLATTPPVIDIPWEGASGFDWELSENGKLYVPAASIDAYKAADGWKEFKSIIAL